MIAADHDWRLQFAALDEFVHRQAELGAFPITQPTDACWQSLEVDSFLGERNPALQCAALRKKLQHQAIRAANVRGISRQRNPAERTATLAEQRPNVFRHESGDLERIYHP